MDHLDVRLVVAARSSLHPERAVSTREPAQWRMEETGTGDVTGLGVDFENPYAHCRKCVSTDKIERLRNDAGR
jgi:hypothetical protein